MLPEERIQIFSNSNDATDADFFGNAESRVTANNFRGSSSRYRYTWNGIHVYTDPKLSHEQAFWHILVTNYWYPILVKKMYEACAEVLTSKGYRATPAEAAKGMHLDFAQITRESVMLGFNVEEDTLLGTEYSFIVELCKFSKCGDSLSWRYGLSTFKR